MTETRNRNEIKKSDVVSTHDNVPGHVYVYESAGISEREGNVPVWLWVVVVTLLLWGFYYLVTYWSAPIGPT
jgi:hypothetical protein